MEQKGYKKSWKKGSNSTVSYKPKRGKLAPLMFEEAKQSAGHMN